MSDIRFNSWLHRSGTGGVYQDSSGRVGIGTSSPGEDLHISSNSPYIKLEDIDNSQDWLIRGTAWFDIYDVNNSAARLRIQTDGKIGINTTDPSRQLEVFDATQGTIAIKSGDAGQSSLWLCDSDINIGGIYYEHANNALGIRVNDAEKFRIDNAGNVNITGITTAKSFVPTQGQTSHKNLLINGNMQITQRGSNFTSISGITTYPVDRFIFSSSGDSVWSATQSTAGSVLANTGFAHAVKIDCTTADTSLGNTHEFWISQRVEAQSLQHLRWGNAAAVTLTLSFWTRSNKTGDYGLWFYAQDGARQYATTYTISSADTWEKKVITIPGDSSGTINNDTGSGFECRWYLGAGSSYAGTPASTWTGTLNNRTTTLNLADSTSNEWYLTGAQLEVGSVATPFEVRSYGEELARCQRYYYTLNNNTTTYYWFHPINSGNYRRCPIRYPVTMRAAPTVSGATGSNNGSVGTPTGTQHVDIDHADFHWDVSNSAHLVDLRSADFSSEL